MSNEIAVGRVFSTEVVKKLDESRKRRRRVFGNVLPDETDTETGISEKQRARMALYYPHFYSVSAEQLLEAVVEERGGRVAVAEKSPPVLP